MNQRYPQSRHTPHRGSEKPTQGKVPAFLRGIERALLRRAPDVPCGRLVFSRPQLRRTGARLSGRAHRPDDDAVPPMEDIEDDRSEVLAAAEVDRGGLQPLAHAASAAAKTTRTNGGFVAERLYLC